VSVGVNCTLKVRLFPALRTKPVAGLQTSVPRHIGGGIELHTAEGGSVPDVCRITPSQGWHGSIDRKRAIHRAKRQAVGVTNL